MTPLDLCSPPPTTVHQYLMTSRMDTAFGSPRRCGTRQRSHTIQGGVGEGDIEEETCSVAFFGECADPAKVLTDLTTVEQVDHAACNFHGWGEYFTDREMRSLWAPLDMPETGAEALDYLRCVRLLGDRLLYSGVVIVSRVVADVTWTRVYDGEGRLHFSGYVDTAGFWSFRFPTGPATGISRIEAEKARLLVGGGS